MNVSEELFQQVSAVKDFLQQGGVYKAWWVPPKPFTRKPQEAESNENQLM